MFKRHRFVVVSVGEQALGGPTLPLASCGQTSAPAGASGRLGPPPGVKLWLRHQSWGSDDGRNAAPVRASCALPTATGWSVNQRVCPGDRDGYMKLHRLPAKRTWTSCVPRLTWGVPRGLPRGELPAWWPQAPCPCTLLAGHTRLLAWRGGRGCYGGAAVSPAPGWAPPVFPSPSSCPAPFAGLSTWKRGSSRWSYGVLCLNSACCADTVCGQARQCHAAGVQRYQAVGQFPQFMGFGFSVEKGCLGKPSSIWHGKRAGLLPSWLIPPFTSAAFTWPRREPDGELTRGEASSPGSSGQEQPPSRAGSRRLGLAARAGDRSPQGCCSGRSSHVCAAVSRGEQAAVRRCDVPGRGAASLPGSTGGSAGHQLHSSWVRNERSRVS